MTKRPGVVTTIIVLGVSALILLVFISLAAISGNQLGQVSTTANSEQVFLAAEAGINHGLYQLTSSPGAQTINTNVNNVPVTVTIAIDPTDPLGQRRIITSVASIQGIQRTLRVNAVTNAMASNLIYAVQTGSGGIVMDNNSEIWGNLYANGPVTGGGVVHGNLSNSGSGTVDGVEVGTNTNPAPSVKCPDTTVTDPSFNNHVLKSHSLTNTRTYGKNYYVSVSGNVRAGTAGNISCTLAGDGINCFGGQPDPGTTAYPITQQQLDSYKDLADNNIVPGDVNITVDTTLSSRKIIGNLSVTSGTLTLDGPVWVTGTIDIAHPGITVRIPASAGTGSGVLMSDQTIDIKNSGNLMGSGDPKSFLLLISFKNDISTWAIQGANNSTAVIYFTPDGLIDVSNNAGLNNTTGKKIHLNNGSCVQYDPNLSSFFVPGGPPQPIGTVGNTWNEL